MLIFPAIDAHRTNSMASTQSCEKLFSNILDEAMRGFTEGADSDSTDAELRAAGRHRSSRQLPTYAKRTRKQLISGNKKRREERTKAADLSE